MVLSYAVVSDIQELSGFQADLGTTGPGQFLDTVRGNWFSGSGVYNSVVTTGTSGPPDDFYRVLGYCMEAPLSISGVGDLARITYRYEGPGEEIVSAAVGYSELVDKRGDLIPVTGDRVVHISLQDCDCYDANGDRKVSWIDIAPFSASYGSTFGDPLYRTQYDHNHDGRVNWVDIAPFSGCYGASW